MISGENKKKISSPLSSSNIQQEWREFSPMGRERVGEVVGRKKLFETTPGRGKEGDDNGSIHQRTGVIFFEMRPVITRNVCKYFCRAADKSVRQLERKCTADKKIESLHNSDLWKRCKCIYIWEEYWLVIIEKWIYLGETMPNIQNGDAASNV